MALYLGAIMGGPEHIDKGFRRQMDAITLREEVLQRDMIRPSDGLLNVVFLFSGTLFRPDFSDIRVGRYVKKENRLEIRVPVPTDAICSGAFVARYVALLKEAITQAKQVFDKKAVPFSLEDHMALVDKSVATLTSNEMNQNG
jgi:hypothetical protein